MWDLEQDENYVLDAGNEIMDPSETIICCAFSPGEGWFILIVSLLCIS